MESSVVCMSQNAGFTPHGAGSAFTYPGEQGDSACRELATHLVLTRGVCIKSLVAEQEAPKTGNRVE
jgi:hypothetical protein